MHSMFAHSSLDGRLRESALLRAVGARKGVVLGALWVEFLVLGGLAGALASVGAEVAAWGLQTQVFEMSWTPTPVMWALGPTLGAVIVGALGVWSCRRAVEDGRPLGGGVGRWQGSDLGSGPGGAPGGAPVAACCVTCCGAASGMGGTAGITTAPPS